MDHVAAAEAEIQRFGDLVREADLSLPVPSCSGWDLAELVRHVGRIRQWAGTIVRDASPRYLSDDDIGLDIPPQAADLPPWLDRQSRLLIDALRGTDPDTPAWAWGPREQRSVRWWGRRMLHENAVHRIDAELALGLTPRVEASVAVDGVEEFLANLPSAAVFAPDVAKLTGTGQTIALETAGTDWLITLEPGGFVWARSSARADVTVRGRADDLYRFVWGRCEASALAVSGDTDLLARWVACSAI